ncbi:hypothetical protein [Agrobacterium vaccinii]|uniref:RraA family protein n=1 Tax=Agrobacterium vaccinii TaxID=2735528 RepID=UPI001E31E6FE|nr:hypothetical protein [Agrobacterium vaccinii]
MRGNEELLEGSFPVFAAGVTHRAPYKDGPGEVNVPIAVNGMFIEPGDLVCGDSDGLLSVPLASVETVFEAHRRSTQQKRSRWKTSSSERTTHLGRCVSCVTWLPYRSLKSLRRGNIRTSVTQAIQCIEGNRISTLPT